MFAELLDRLIDARVEERLRARERRAEDPSD